MGADDDDLHPWLGPVKDLIRDAVAGEVPTLGICLGHQLIAVALGGSVGPNPLGQQVGVLDVGWTDDAAADELVGGAAGRIGVQWNDDVVTALPEGATVLARTARGELQAARFAPTVWGVQLHPEVDEPILRRWAEGDRERHLAAGIDQEAVLADVEAAAAELGGGLASAGAPARRAGAAPAMTRATTGKGNLLRLGFQDTERAAGQLAELGESAGPLLAPMTLSADPDLAVAGLVRLADAVEDRAAMLAELADDEGTAMRLLGVLGASVALADHLARHPEHWRELTDPMLGLHPAGGVRRARGPAARGRRGPGGAEPRRRPARPGGDGRAAGGVPPAAAAARRSRPRPPPRRRRRRRRAVRPGRRHARGGPGRGPGPGRRRRRDGPARRDRDGQVRRPRAQLRLRRRRDLRLRARRRGRRERGRPGRDPARQPPDAGLLRPHRRGHDLAGRRGAAARGQGRTAGPHPGQPPRLLRALGQDLGVPGPAQGPPGRR